MPIVVGSCIHIISTVKYTHIIIVFIFFIIVTYIIVILLYSIFDVAIVIMMIMIVITRTIVITYIWNTMKCRFYYYHIFDYLPPFIFHECYCYYCYPLVI